MTTGTILRFNRRYGFITPTDDRKPEIFFHRTALTNQRWLPIAGDTVSYEESLNEADKRICAVKVAIIKEAEPVSPVTQGASRVED